MTNLFLVSKIKKGICKDIYQKTTKCGSFFPTPALPGSGDLGMISARLLGHPL